MCLLREPCAQANTQSTLIRQSTQRARAARYNRSVVEPGAWMSAREAAAHLDVKLATLYAYASRGWIESVPATTGRGHRYARSAVERLKARHDARAGHAAVAAGALRWGEPSIETSISELDHEGPRYRGHGALSLCDTAESFESVAELLWSGRLGAARWSAASLRVSPPRRPARAGAIAYFAAALASAALRDHTRHGASDLAEHARARRVIRFLAGLDGRSPRAHGSIAERLLTSFRVRASSGAVHALDRALILCADHELNASTFAARVTASTGADLYACIGAALFALTGPKHGGVTTRIEALLQDMTSPARARRLVLDRLARGDAIPGFGHVLYKDGDPRARKLLELARAQRATSLTRVEALVDAMERAGQPLANLDLGLVALCRSLALPEGAPAAVFAVGRVAGWVAHSLEQRAQGYLLRPRSRYVPSG
jgi:citrate synthase